MPGNTPQVITSRQAKAQIDHFGRSLIIYIAVFMLFRYGTSLLYSYIPGMLSSIDSNIVLQSGEIILLILIALIPFRISANMLHLDIHDYLEHVKIKPGRMLCIACIGIGINLMCTSLASIFAFFGSSSVTSYSYLGQFNTQTNIINNILYFIKNVLVVPICDEYIFRGIIQRQLGHYGRYFGVLGSAMLFAISRGTLVDALPAFFVGWYLSLITLKYHSIHPGIQMHIILAGFLWLLNIAPSSMLLPVTLLIIAVYVVAGFSIFSRRVSTNMVRYGATEPKLWKILLTSPTIIICILLFIGNIVLSTL
ncbi:MAG: CPBP family intramembrane metalloprotease [Solobacterium sp.]|jgi:hypothetical protein|nr:CPBP family intramembrane metalloprotease [Solobacterium sp.]MCH4223227.1 CPBP family intramembrane metalloprotease [Solobacterium sp.]MCH4265862.1 CPBP family intramembrane metalloprotease [Solobacterium sp.]